MGIDLPYTRHTIAINHVKQAAAPHVLSLLRHLLKSSELRPPAPSQQRHARAQFGNMNSTVEALTSSSTGIPKKIFKEIFKEILARALQEDRTAFRKRVQTCLV